MKQLPKKRYKNIAIAVMALVILVAVGIFAKAFYDWSYKQGYLDGTNNQVVCQAAQKDQSLSKLCK